MSITDTPPHLYVPGPWLWGQGQDPRPHAHQQRGGAVRWQWTEGQVHGPQQEDLPTEETGLQAQRHGFSEKNKSQRERASAMRCPCDVFACVYVWLLCKK